MQNLAPELPDPQALAEPSAEYERQAPAIASDPLVPVTRRMNVYGYPATGEDTPELVRHVPLSEALRGTYSTEACFCAASCPTIPHRLNKPFFDEPRDAVTMVAFVFDVDGPSKRPKGEGATQERLRAWQAENDAWWAEQQAEALPRLFSLYPGALVYRTQSGYRIVFRLATPVVLRNHEDGEAWALRYHRACLRLYRWGILADPKCSNWTRLHRLPHCTRDRKRGPERREIIGDPACIDAWEHEPTADELAGDIRTAERILEALEPGDTRNGYRAILNRLRPRPVPTPTPAHEFTAAAPLEVANDASGAPLRARARAHVEAMCSAMASLAADGGGRNAQVCKVGSVVGGLLAGGPLPAEDEPWAVGLMHEACRVNGYASDRTQNPAAVIRSAIAHGRTRPITTLATLARRAPVTRAARLQAWKAELHAWVDAADLSFMDELHASQARKAMHALVEAMNMSTRRAYPSLLTVAGAMGLRGAHRAEVVSRLFKRLERAGFLRVVRPRVGEFRKANEYEFKGLPDAIPPTCGSNKGLRYTTRPRTSDRAEPSSDHEKALEAVAAADPPSSPASLVQPTPGSGGDGRDLPDPIPTSQTSDDGGQWLAEAAAADFPCRPPRATTSEEP